MTTFILILLSVALFIGALLVIALIVKKDYSIQREILVNKTPAEVFSFIRCMKNQDYYNKWWMADPNVKKEFTGTDGTVGFITKWDSTNKQVGKGEQEITAISDGQRIDFEIRFIRPFEGVAYTFMSTEGHGNQTLVRWGFAGKNKLPVNLIYFVFNLEKVMGNDIQSSLSSLKQSLEK